MGIDNLENNKKFEAKINLDKATDSELAMFFIRHIDNPCEAETASGEIVNIRNFYIEEAKRALLKMTNPDAKKALELKIQEYSQ